MSAWSLGSLSAPATQRSKRSKFLSEGKNLGKGGSVHHIQTSGELVEQISSLTADLVKAKTNFKRAKGKKKALQETCRELIEQVERLEEQVKMHADPAEMLENQDDNIKDDEKDKLEEDLKGVNASDVTVPILRTFAKMITSRRREMKSNGSVKSTGSVSRRTCKCREESDVFVESTRLNVQYLSSANQVLYISNAHMTRMVQHWLAFGPTSIYDAPTAQWIDGFDLSLMHGGTCELFTERKRYIIYVGNSPPPIMCPARLSI
ncbi:hypothetical protein DFH08DRAFT_814098 [Mycena albidolilacea]|uniref:Uncharacterized protein n=1 Tax=Mycena albidolilacea TaxID=1033008 RepID=A0AAD6ZQC4_9AGAR|nr:hypothetical protein DFH08DRAFT_814098 [Mycena albidolilacea]